MGTLMAWPLALSAAPVSEVPAGTKFIGVSCMFSTEWPVVRPLVKRLRARFPRLPILAGGEHPTACADYVLADCPELDMCARGEGEEVIAEVADALARGSGPIVV